MNVSSGAVVGLFDSRSGLAKLVEDVLNQILDAQATEALGADRYERTEERRSLRNGYRTRTLSTRVGPLTLRVPQTRDGSFSTEHAGLTNAIQRHLQGATWPKLSRTYLPPAA